MSEDRPLKVFIPGIGLGSEDVVICSSSSHALYSYWSLKGVSDGKIEESFGKLRDAGVRIVLDSGAFSAWTSGVVIEIDEFAAFVRKWHDYLDFVFTLDVIGDDDGTYQNWIYLQNEYPDLAFCPVWHSQSTLGALEKILKHEPYLVGLGGIASGKGMSIAKRVKFLHSGVTYIHGKGAKTHALGVGSLELLLKVPITYADSTSWHIYSRYGKLWTPFERFSIIRVGWRTWLNKPEVEQEIDQYFADEERAAYVQGILKRIGADFQDLIEDNEVLSLFNLEAFLVALENREPLKIKRRMLM